MSRSSTSPQNTENWTSNKEESDLKKDTQQTSMSKGKTPPNNPITAGFHHLLPGGPLFNNIASHSNNIPQPGNFNPGLLII